MTIKDSIIDNFSKPVTEVTSKPPTMAEWSKRIKDLGKTIPSDRVRPEPVVRPIRWSWS